MPPVISCEEQGLFSLIKYINRHLFAAIGGEMLAKSVGEERMKGVPG